MHTLRYIHLNVKLQASSQMPLFGANMRGCRYKAGKAFGTRSLLHFFLLPYLTLSLDIGHSIRVGMTDFLPVEIVWSGN